MGLDCTQTQQVSHSPAQIVISYWTHTHLSKQDVNRNEDIDSLMHPHWSRFASSCVCLCVMTQNQWSVHSLFSDKPAALTTTHTQLHIKVFLPTMANVKHLYIRGVRVHKIHTLVRVKYIFDTEKSARERFPS